MRALFDRRYPRSRRLRARVVLVHFVAVLTAGACTPTLDDLRPGVDAGPRLPPVTTLPMLPSPTVADAVNPDPSALTDPSAPSDTPDTPSGEPDIAPGDTTDWQDTDISDTTRVDTSSGGNADDAGGDTTEQNTSNASPLQLLQTMPADDEADVAVGTGLTLEFNQEVRAGQGFITLSRTSTAAVLEQLAVTDARVTFVGSSVVIDWATEFTLGTTYAVTVDAGAIVSDSDPTQAEASITLHFATEAPKALLLEGTTPLTSSLDVDPNANLVLIFSEGIMLGSGELQLWRAASSDTLVETFDSSSSGLTVSANTLVIDPYLTLFNSNTYYVTVSSSAVRSVQGGPFEGIDGPTRFRFTTAAAPPEPLLLDSSVPADNALDVAPNSTITLRFSEPIRAGNGSIAVVDAATQVAFESAMVIDPRVVLSASTATFSLSAPLTMARSYYVTVDAGAFESLPGASFAGISSASRLNFTVQGAPPECASDEYPSASGGCYFVGTSMLTYASAANACAARGNGWALAEPRSAAAQSTIEPLLTTDVWIGASDLQNEGVWRWQSDGRHFWSGTASGTPVPGEYTRWRNIEPTGGNHNCARVMYVTEDAGWYWADAPCDYQYQYLCQGPMD